MKPAADIPNILSYNFDHDYKAEVLAAELVESGLPIDRVLILMMGGKKRSYRKDADFAEEEFSGKDHNDYTIINTPKEGIYDMLPEALFHTVTLHDDFKSQAEIANFIKIHHQEEANARRFFIPFEIAINQLRIQLALLENRLDKRWNHSELPDIFAANWEIFNYLDQEQANVFVNLLPMVHYIRDDYQLAQGIMEMVLMTPVKITARRRRPVLIEDPMVSTMEDCALGVNMTTGNIIFDDGENTLQIAVGPMPRQQLNRFIPGSKQHKVFELLCDYLLPVHLDITTEFELNPEDKICVLADGDDDGNSTMGFSTYL